MSNEALDGEPGNTGRADGWQQIHGILRSVTEIVATWGGILMGVFSMHNAIQNDIRVALWALGASLGFAVLLHSVKHNRGAIA